MKTCKRGLHQYPSEIKTCPECQRIAARARYATNPAYQKAYSHARYKANPDAAKAERNARYAANPDAQKRMSALRYEANREDAAAKMKAYRENNTERLKVLAKKWAGANKSKLTARNARRRAKTLRATPPWANPVKIEEFYYTANMLGMHTGEAYHVDHIVPLQSKLVCGLHSEGNLQILTAKENMAKGAKILPYYEVTNG